MAQFVLIHGMFHGGWCWARLAAALEARGHHVAAPDLAGCGSDTTPLAHVTLDRWANDIAAVAAASAEKVILVGHSRGGVVASAVAERVPGHVAAIVFIAALMLPNGASAMSVPALLAEHPIEGAGDMMQPTLSADGLSLLPPDNADRLWYAEYTLDARVAALAQIGPEPLAPLMTPLSLTAAAYGSVPKIYVEFSRDRTLPVSLQRLFVQLGTPDEVLSLDGDHMAIVTEATPLAALLDGVAERANRKAALPFA